MTIDLPLNAEVATFKNNAQTNTVIEEMTMFRMTRSCFLKLIRTSYIVKH